MTANEQSTLSYANIFDIVRNENYNLYNKEYARTNGQIDSRTSFYSILNNYLQKISEIKFEKNIFIENVKRFAKGAVEHLTGNYEIGVGNISFEELTENAETISSIYAYSNNNELTELLKTPEELSRGVVDGAVADSLIISDKETKAKDNFELSSDRIKKFFKEAIHNITHINQVFTNTIAHLTGMDKESSNGLENNIMGKFIGGMLYEFLSGTLVSKRHFTNVTNSKSMQEKIQNEGILHFTSPSNIDKIMKSQYIKKSDFLKSDLTKGKSFFFAGVPSFEDVIINIPAYNVMTAIRIRPTEEQMNELKYRALNDRAVVKDGDFHFNNEQADVVYFGLMYDEKKGGICLGELTKEQAKDFKVDDRVKKAYNYVEGRNSLIDSFKLNTYGLYAEYKHHQKLLEMEKLAREKGISFRDVDDSTLVKLADIRQAYISTEDKSIQRRDLFSTIKQNILRRNNEQERREIEDDRSI